MRRLVVGGGLGIAACLTGALLSSGAASARQAADTITVSGVANGTSVVFTGSGSPFHEIGRAHV